MTTRVCPKCGKDFSTNPYWSTDLKRHLDRKNSCDRPIDSKYIREKTPKEPPRNFLRSLDSVEWATPNVPHSNTPKRFVAPWFFKQIMKDSANVCFVKPNVSKNEIWVKVSKEDPVRIVKMEEFLNLFVQYVMRPLFPKNWDGYGDYSCWLYSENGVDLDDSGPIDIIYDDEFKFGMRDALKEFLVTYPAKVQLKNMLINFI